ncbi:MAG: PAS domain-containing sensor histidine kinase [bacterium]|nr:MAG: PAS domain-containing sensor histidine kinase [bacterium]
MEGDVTLSRQDDQLFVIKTLITFRLIVITFFLGTVIFFELRYGGLSFPVPISLLVSVTYLITIIYLLMLNRISRYMAFLYFQLVLDLIIETGIIYCTGGMASPFTFFYMFTIIASAILLSRAASWIMATSSSILYGTLVNLSFYGIIKPLPLISFAIPPTKQEFVFFNMLVHIASFYLVAFLSDYLSQRLRLTLRAYISKSRDLTNLQAFHENVITNMGSGYLALDMYKQIISANQAAELILEQPTDNLKRLKLGDVFTTLKVEEILPNPDSIEERVKKNEWIYLTKNGEQKFLSAASSLFLVETGKVRGFIVVFQDITHYKKMEDAMARADRLAAIGRIAAGLAHEIRNPLGSISGSVQMLSAVSKEKLSPQNEKLMSIVLKETDRLNGIIERLLSAASPSTKKLKDVSLAGIINDAVILFRNDAKYSGQVRVTADLDERMRCEIDPESMKQVFWNLMINAAQAMPYGGEIAVKMAPISNSANIAGECEITFSDTGSGVPEEDVTKIFEPFYTTKRKGTGLGLSTVLKIIENHNGFISVSRNENNGATFSIRIPL